MKNLRVESHGGTIPYCWRGRKQLNIRLNQQQANQENPPGCIQFQSAGLLEAEKSIKGDANDGKTSSQPLKVHHKDQSSKNVLRQASDWKIQFDLELDSLTSPKRAKAFPSEIAVVSGKDHAQTE